MSMNRSGDAVAADARRLDERLERMELALGLAKPEPTISGAISDLERAIRSSGGRVERLTAHGDGSIALTMRTSEDCSDLYKADRNGTICRSIPLMNPGSGEPRRKTNLERLAEMRVREDPDATLAESENKRCAVLLHMINELRDAGAFCDDSVLKMTMFLIVNLDNPGFEYSYYLDMGGPNCRDLQGDINWLGSDWYHREHHPYGRNFLVLPKGEDFLRRFPATIEQCGPSVEMAAGIAGSRPLAEFMRLVSAMYLMLCEEGRSMTPEELVEFYLRVRGLDDRPVIAKAFEDARELLSNSAAGQAASA